MADCVLPWAPQNPHRVIKRQNRWVQPSILPESNGKEPWQGEQLGRLSWLCHWALQPMLCRSSQPLKVVAAQQQYDERCCNVETIAVSILVAVGTALC